MYLKKVAHFDTQVPGDYYYDRAWMVADWAKNQALLIARQHVDSLKYTSLLETTLKISSESSSTSQSLT